jgi:holin-like protein
MRWLFDGALFCVGTGFLFLAEKLGDEAVTRLGLPIPGALVGMVLLFAGLNGIGGVTRPLALAAGGLLRHMMLFLMPVVAGVLDHLGLLQGHWIQFLASCLMGTVVTLMVTAVILQRLLRKEESR